jgi:hypothetical protein
MDQTGIKRMSQIAPADLTALPDRRILRQGAHWGAGDHLKVSANWSASAPEVKKPLLAGLNFWRKIANPILIGDWTTPAKVKIQLSLF